MIYLDYSATTMTNKEVLDSFNKASTYFGNPNSLHKLGVEAKKLIDASTEQIASILKCKKEEIIYTSGATESNNMAIKGVCFKYQNRGKHIITTKLEHSSISEPLKYLEGLGFIIDYVNLDNNGSIDLDDLKNKLRDDTILVTISSVTSEVGTRNNIKEISKIVHSNNKTILHVDMTQSIGKEVISLEGVDLASMSAHKFYGIKGIGILYKRESLIIDPLLMGGKSTTIYRSGTPATSLIVSMSKALRLQYEDIDKKIEHVKELNKYLRDKLSSIEEIHINSTDTCIPHILNISIKDVKPETMLHALEENDIYISTKTACSDDDDYSLSVYSVTNNMDYAKTSIRISLSHLTTKEELDEFVNVLTKEIKKLTTWYN